MGESILRGRLMVAACAGMAMFGVVLVLLGTLFGMPDMRARLGLTDMVRQGSLQSVQFIGLLAATVVVGPLIDRFGNKLVLAVSSLLVTLALLGFARADGYGAARLCAVILGIGGGGLNTSTNVLVSDIYGDERGPQLNILGIFFGVGALLVPVMVATLSAVFTVQQVIVAAAGLAAVCSVAYLALTFPPAREAHAFSLRGAVRVVGYPGVLLFALLLFFESGNESAMVGWISTWLGGAGASAQVATLVLGVFQLGMMSGRMMGAYLLRFVSKPRLVLGSALGGFAGCLVLFLGRSPVLGAIGVALAGLSFAAIYPTVLAIAGDRYQQMAGTVFGVLFSIAITGAVIFPRLIGWMSQTSGVHSGTLLPLAGTVAICVIISVIMARDRTRALAPIANSQ